MDKEVLNRFVSEMTNTLKQAKEFTAAQAPVVFKQILYFRTADSLMGLVFGVLLGLSAFQLFKYAKAHETDYNYEGRVMLASFGCFGAGAFSFCLIGENLQTLLKISLAPNVFLIEYFANLVK